MSGKTLYDKIWDSHLVKEREDGTSLIYIDRHLIHEVTSPQAFEGLRMAGRQPWRASANFATPDHNIPTTSEERKQGLEGIKDPVSKIQVSTLDDNCSEFNIFELKMNDLRQGIVHVVGPEQGATLPGMTIVCGDSHTSTHGALGALAHGIGTSEVEHVLATQCLMQKKMKNMLIRVDGELPTGVTAKDIVLAIIGKIGTAGGTGYTIEFGGEAIRSLSIEGRMTICNMAIEAGARAGLVAVDEVTLEYIKGRPFAPKGALWGKAAQAWKELVSDSDAHFDSVIELQAADIEPQVTWGTSPERWWRRSPGQYRHWKMKRMRPSGAIWNRPCDIWGFPAAPPSRIFDWTVYSSVPARTRGSKTCAKRQRSLPARKSLQISRWRSSFRVPGW